MFGLPNSSFAAKWSLLWLSLAVLLGTVGCKANSAPEAPAKNGTQQGAEESDDPGVTEIDEPELPEDDGGDEDEEELKLAIAPESMADLKVGTSSAASIPFTLTGASGKDLIIGLSEAPIGVTLVQSGDTVTLSWPTPLVGTYGLRFILRDRDRCEAAESDAADCEISAADFGRIGAESYDVSSDRYTIEVTEGGILGDSGDPSLIAAIIKALGSGGGGLQGFLSGLTNTQLQDILALAQDGFGIGAILGMLGL